MSNTTEQHGHLDFLKTAQIQNAIMQTLTSAPGSPNEAQMYFDKTLDTFRIYDDTNTKWISMMMDDDYGDITISSNETVMSINANVIGLTELLQATSDIFIGRDTAGTGNLEILSMTAATAMLNLFSTTTTAQGLVPGSNSGGASVYLDGSGNWSSPGGGFADFDAGGDNGANVTVNSGDLYDVVGALGLDTTVSKASTTVTLSVALELNALSEKSGNLVGSDRLTGVSGTTHFSETISNIPLSIFDNDSAWTDNVGTVTSVSAGNGMTFSTITTTGSVTLGTPSTLTSSTTNGVTTNSHTHELDISGFASTDLSDTANIVYTNAVRTINVTHTISTGNKLTLTDDPVADTDAANKRYVDNVAQGLDAKQSVLAMSASNLDLSGAETIDGVSVTAGDRVLVTGQTTTEDNGIYVAAAGSWSRASDMNTWDKHVSAFVFVEEGTTYGDTGWVCTVDAGGTLGTTAITWVQFSNSGSYSTGNGLTESGTVFSLGTPSTLTSITTNEATTSSHTHELDHGIGNNQIIIADSGAISSGEYAKFTANGLESKSIAEMQTDLGVVRKYATTIGNGSLTSFNITHGLNTEDVIVRVRQNASPYEYIDVPVELDNTTPEDIVVIEFLTAPTSNQYRVIVTG